MTELVILALLAGNLYFAKKLLSRDNKKSEPAEVETTEVQKDEKSDAVEEAKESNGKPHNPLDSKIAAVIGTSNYDSDTYRNIVKEVVKEVVPLIIEEYGNYADAGLPEPPSKTDPRRVPDENLDDVFTNRTVSELTGEEPDTAEPRADGIDFNDMNTTMKVLKKESDKSEDVAVAQKTLRELEGTTIKEQISLDPNIRKRIMLIELHLPSSEPEEDAQESDYDSDSDNEDSRPEKHKKILFRADIDTTGIDIIDFNVIH